MRLISYTCRALGTHPIAKGVKATYDGEVLIIECGSKEKSVVTAVTAYRGEEIIITIDRGMIAVSENKKSASRGANSESRQAI